MVQIKRTSFFQFQLQVQLEKSDMSLFWIAVLDWSIQWSVFGYSISQQTEKYYDLTGSLTFLLLSMGTYLWSSQFARQTVATLCVTIWAVRLGNHESI